MERHIPQPGEVYRHFKGNVYEIVLIARDSETLEEKVVYKNVDGTAAYVRALAMFMSPINKEKYPNATQEYRFELLKETMKSAAVEKQELSDEMRDKELILNFLDLASAEDKIQYFLQVKDDITENFLQVVAQSLDFVENQGDLSQRYEDILKYLRTLAKYECGRLR